MWAKKGSLAQEPAVRHWTAVQIGSFVAIGDSFTEGLDDPHPDPALGYRGWTDLVAQRLAARRPDFRHANLALRGRLA